MSKPPDNIIDLSETLSISEYKTGGQTGFWLYDETRGMNLAIRAKSETDAFVEALLYYQERLTEVETAYTELNRKVKTFVDQFIEDDLDDLYI